MDAASIERVRSFNRTVTARVGALSDHFLGRRRPLGEARLLWEIGPDGAEARELRQRLSLDSGYLSRLLRSLERQRLVAVDACRTDGRVRRVRLTQAGRAERRQLDRRSDAAARALLEPLTTSQRSRLLTAMGEVERLLAASLVEFVAEDPTSPVATWCLSQYFAELAARFERGFDPAITTLPDAAELAPPKGLFLVARLRGRPVACGALRFHPGAPTEIKRMWVDTSVRGIGLGRRLLFELERHARAAGTKVLQLETNRALTEAINLYRQSGFVEVPAFNEEPYGDYWFEKRLEDALD
jgi:DNA-binding MarR family transcriptional regulator/GNAT superfamily N-acetyltransferase